MHVNDMPIHSNPCVNPSTNVNGSGLLAANAHTSSAAYMHEWVNDTHFNRPTVIGPTLGVEAAGVLRAPPSLR